jgi:hypothetical protein
MITFKEYYLKEELTDEQKKLIALGLASAAALPITAHLGQKAGEALRPAPAPIVQSAQPSTQLPPPIVAGQPVVPQPAGGGADTNATAQQFFDRLAREEGFRARVYNDTAGNPTIGYGHHLDGTNEDRQAVATAVEGAGFNAVNYDNLLGGTETVDENGTGRAIFNVDLDHHLAIARRLVPAFDTLPVEVELALADAAFRTDLQGSPDAVTLMNNNQWVEAAAEYIDNDEYRASRAQGARHGVWQRMDRNAAAFRQYGEALIRQQNNR